MLLFAVARVSLFVLKSLITIAALFAIVVVAVQRTGINPMGRVEYAFQRAVQMWEDRRRLRHLERVAAASPDAREFRRLYPAAKIEPIYSYDGSSAYFAKYDQLLLTVGLYERYVLTLYVPFQRGTTTPEKAVFHLTEVVPEGYQTRQPAEKHVWDCIRLSGDLRAFGVETLTNSPVDRFERFWKAK